MLSCPTRNMHLALELLFFIKFDMTMHSGFLQLIVKPFLAPCSTTVSEMF